MMWRSATTTPPRGCGVTVDGEVVETEASGETAPGGHWGLVLGSSWGNTLEGSIDAFRMTDAPGWASWEGA